jgi:hypothetical protein
MQAGGADVGAETADGHHRITATFRSVADAMRTVVELAAGTPAMERSLPDVAAAGGGLRMALCTGESGGDRGPGGVSPRDRAVGLLGHALPGQVLATASTAVLAARTLPRGVELVDRGNVRLGSGRPPERVYRLRIEDDQPPEERIGASNLEWARRAVDGPVLGFDEPLAALVAAWKSALDGRPRLVLLTGDAAPALTIAAAEAALRLHAEGAQVLYGRWDRRSAGAYDGVREALGVHADGCSTEALRAQLDGWGDEIGRLLPDVGARVGGRPHPAAASRTARAGMFGAVETWLQALARRRPTLLVLDDLHHADPASLALLERLRHPHGSDPLLVVVTAALGGAPGWVEAFAADADGSEFDHIPLQRPCGQARPSP